MADTVNFEVTTDIAKVGEMQIEANYDAVKAYIEEAMSGYKNIIVTPDTIQEAKKDRATVRKVAKRIDDYRKTVKAEWTAPVREFEAKCKELTAICTEASDHIDAQIKRLESEREIIEEPVERPDSLQFNRILRKKGEHRKTYALKVRLTRAQFDALTEFLDFHDIEYSAKKER